MTASLLLHEHLPIKCVGYFIVLAAAAAAAATAANVTES